MVAMGSSFADRAWDRESAVYRVAGVFNVIGGWFVTALAAFLSSAIIAYILFIGEVFAFFAFILWALAQQADTAQALLITPVWFVLLARPWAAGVCGEVAPKLSVGADGSRKRCRRRSPVATNA